MTHEVRRKQSELYGKKYDQESNIQRYILSAVIALTNFLLLFLPGSCHWKLADLIIGLTNKRHEVTRNECQ